MSTDEKRSRHAEDRERKIHRATATKAIISITSQMANTSIHAANVVTYNDRIVMSSIERTPPGAIGSIGSVQSVY